ncbi:Vitamin B12-binding protein [Gracilariopsis chorda]|uniref:Vitamin B12-binding protein n=1 Tax=Gracilariopsis chorda TaxID=448386 RepID=A0A2V3INN8_9FLOR|nr:Vitamin B12-binding protein [Gracilariopsis chorda]|eukprot:PXF43669.1 Vitamin B12-binding protein [Gracilariopsis chorda]
MPPGPPSLRIVSLLPSATEIVFALGAGDHVVGVTHECDFPPAATRLPQCTANLLPPNLSAKQIDDAVARVLTEDPHSIYRLEADTVRELKPDVIITQSLCAVCAVPESTVRDISCNFPFECRVVSSDPHSLIQLFESILYIGRAIGYEKEAVALVVDLKARLARVQQLPIPANPPNVAVIEWPDPPYAPGHWVPDMISYAKGTCVLGKPGHKSERISWQQLAQLQVDVVICAFCGYDLYRNQIECDKVRSQNEWKAFVKGANVYATNASAYFSRPGNRLVDGTELLAFLLHRVEAYRPPRTSASQLRNGEWVDVADL